MDQTTIDNLTAQRFIHYLVTPISQWEAYRIGLIDNDGKLKRQPQNQSETKFFNMFHQLVLKLKDLLKTSGRGTNWVLPSTAGSYYLGNKNIPTSNFTNWSISNKSSLPIFGAAYSAMKECINLNDSTIFEELFEYYIDNYDNSMSLIFEEDCGNNAGQVANNENGGCNSWSDYIQRNMAETRKKKRASEIFKTVNSMVTT